MPSFYTPCVEILGENANDILHSEFNGPQKLFEHWMRKRINVCLYSLGKRKCWNVLLVLKSSINFDIAQALKVSRRFILFVHYAMSHLCLKQFSPSYDLPKLLRLKNFFIIKNHNNKIACVWLDRITFVLLAYIFNARTICGYLHL